MSGVIKSPAKFSATRLYNIGFPVLILVPLIIDLVILFIIPTEQTIKSLSGITNIGDLVSTARKTGDVSFFKMRTPANSGQLRPA